MYTRVHAYGHSSVAGCGCWLCSPTWPLPGSHACSPILREQKWGDPVPFTSRWDDSVHWPPLPQVQSQFWNLGPSRMCISPCHFKYELRRVKRNQPNPLPVKRHGSSGEAAKGSDVSCGCRWPEGTLMTSSLLSTEALLFPLLLATFSPFLCLCYPVTSRLPFVPSSFPPLSSRPRSSVLLLFKGILLFSYLTLFFYVWHMWSLSCVWLFSTPWPGFSVLGISQARLLECVATSCSRESSRFRDLNLVSCVSCIGRQILYHWCHQGSPFYIYLF